MTDATIGRATAGHLSSAVHRATPWTRQGLLERLFTLAFRGLVYPQIWEDPVVDMEALRLGPGDHLVTIASGGCNALSYLTADPARVTALDLNGWHVALLRLKIAALQSLPDHARFYRFFGEARSADVLADYARHIAPALDAETRAFWDRINWRGRKRISLFARDFYRHGLLGRCISAGHILSRLHGCRPDALMAARDLAEQREIFERDIAPIFDKGLMKAIFAMPASLYGLGIPPAQYDALTENGRLPIAGVLRERLRRLACDFPLAENYFARQAFGRSYGPANAGTLPPYLEAANFEIVRARANRLAVRHGSVTDFLAASPGRSVDAYVLLDAQDWMTDADLTALWSEITRTARPGARVIFRTAADERLLPGRVPDDILARWTYDEATSRDAHRRDRSGVYGAFHLWRKAELA